MTAPLPTSELTSRPAGQSLGAAHGSAAGTRHYERFTMECEAYVVHRDDCFVKAIGDPESLPWRACVRTGDGTMHWEWCRSERDALAWIERWKQPNHRQTMNLNDLAKLVHAANIKWWQDVETGQPIERNKGELISLMHSELSEALEGIRKNLLDDKLPHRKMEEVELVDCIIRILDYACGFGLDLQGAFDEKMAYNAQRKDHTHKARRAAGGKQF